MNKNLIKRLLYELIEDVVHLDNQLQQLEFSSQNSSAPYVRLLKQKLTTAKQNLWQHQADFLKLFQEEPLEEKLTNQFVDTVLDTVRQELAPISQSLFRLSKTQPLPETELFLSSLSLEKLLPEAPRLVILPVAPEDMDLKGIISSDSILIAPLSLTDIEAPLRWMGLITPFLKRYAQESLQLTSFLEEMDVPEDSQDFVVPILALRLFGPSYYAYEMLQAFKQPSTTSVSLLIEPLLFKALNHFGFVNKDLVILHQSIERNRGRFSEAKSKNLSKLIANDTFSDELLKLVEKIIPSRLAYTEKSYIHAQLLEGRLAQGYLISAVPMVTSASQLRDDLEILESEASVYPMLSQLKESPATPLEIINAGWFQKLDESSDQLYMALQQDLETGWLQLEQTILAMDALLLKSIETAEVHRVLSFDENDVMVPV